jgi:hypothetical protein
MVLRMYGTAEDVAAAEEALKTKILEVESQTKEIILEP